MSKCLIKAETVDYEGCGEYWVSIDGQPAFLIDGDLIQSVDTQATEEDDIAPDEITGFLGQLMDEVDLPSDLLEQAQELYDRAAKQL